jgi:tRNA threonylcarbamoyladenosine biosynthesis protein TsaB
MKTPLQPLALVFDCACSGLSLAVLRGEEILAAQAETTLTGQSALLAPAIVKVLAQAGVATQELSLIGVTNGPGSFTGIRIGLAMARGLAMALKTPLASCSTFEAVLENLSSRQRQANGVDLILAVDSRRDEIFLAMGDSQPARIMRPDDAVAALPVGFYGLAGDGASLVRVAFAAAGREKEIAFSDERPPLAANFAKALLARGVSYWQARNHSDGMPRPLYLREADVTLPKPVAR